MKRLIVLVILMLAIGSFSTVAKTSIFNPTSEKINSLNVDDDVPIWNVGNYWTYDVESFVLNLIQSEQTFGLNLTWENLKFEVKSITTDSYVIEVTGKISGYLLYDNGAGNRLAGKLYFNRFSGNIQFRKSDISLENVNFKLKSIALLSEHPLPIPLPLPIPMTITFNLGNSMPRALIDFPLFDGKMGIIAETSINANITVSSIILKILSIITSSIPAELNFEYEMNIPQLFYNATIEDITVKAGNFNAYNIVFYEGLLGSMYYAPDVGFLIKAQAEFSIEDMLNFKFYGELKDYKYS